MTKAENRKMVNIPMEQKAENLLQKLLDQSIQAEHRAEAGGAMTKVVYERGRQSALLQALQMVGNEKFIDAMIDAIAMGEQLKA